MKNKWGNYSLKDGKVQGSYIREYSCLSPKKQIQKDHYGKANSRTEERDQPEDSPRRIMAECYLPGTQSDSSGQAGSLASPIPSAENTTSNLRGENEIVREKDSVEAYQQGQQGIQEPAERRPEAQERNIETIQREEEEMKEKEKMSAKEKKHEAKEGKKYEKLEDKREARKESKAKRK